MPIEFRPNPNLYSELWNATKEAFEKIKCPEHGTGPIVIGESVKEFRLEFCCEKLKERVEAEATK